LTTRIERAFGQIRATPSLGKIFSCDGQLVRVSHDRPGSSLEKLSKAALRNWLDRRTLWGDWTRGKFVQTPPPNDVCTAILASKDWPTDIFPPLESLQTTPFLSRAGRLVIRPGYDAETKALLIPLSLEMSSVSSLPTSEEVDDAKRTLAEPFIDFAFEHPAHQTMAIALLLTFFVRPRLDNVPLFLIEAPTRASGKTLLIRVLSRIALGYEPLISSFPSSRSELERTITAQLRLGRRLVVFDNVVEPLGGDVLCALLTAPWWSSRALGRSSMLELRNDAIVVATGNNPAVRGDLVRRTVRIRLNTHAERPQDRDCDQFVHPNLLQWCQEQRGRIVHAILTLINRWIADGSPPGASQLGSFETWTRIVGGILQSAGYPEFFDLVRETTPLDEEDENDHLADFLAEWWERFRDTPVLTRDLGKLPALALVFPDLAFKQGASRHKALGRRLVRHLNQVIAGREIISTKDRERDCCRFALKTARPP
jgi:hypothetical protein